ncbi:YidH family protein [Kitasatospora sp. NBC_01539]|uniref:YidH family protein n=1 Tax=Kitasatospora sp. NBC_01539 TaxID=2903577 RepID=UPI0038602378
MDDMPRPEPGHDPDRAGDGAGDAGAWWATGEEPDYRATLANERTFLAWSRTALALLAGALAVLQLATLVPYGLRLAMAGYLLVLSLATTLVGYRQWRVRQQRMRHAQPLGHGPAQAVLTAGLMLLTVLVAVATGFGAR